jgi:hypothetical protein
MNENQAIAFISKYIFDRTGKRVHISAYRIVGNVRQSKMLESAVQMAVKWYKEQEIVN